MRTEVLDPLEGDARLSPLARALADPGVEVVMHAGRQDVALLRRTWETEVTNVFDTQVAAGFLGFGNQEGYESLVRKVLGVKLKGGEGFTKWDRRPLTRSSSSTRATTRGCCWRSGESSSGASRSAAGSSGRGRSAARSRSRATSATPSAVREAAPARPPERQRRAAWPASWSSGARRWPRARTARPAPCSPTRR